MDDLSQYLKPAARRTWIWWLVSAVLLGGGIWAAMEAQRLHQVSLEQKSWLQAHQRANRVLPPPVPTRAELDAEKQWTALRHERSFAWYPVFAALEATASEDIGLLEFVPDKAARTLTLRGTARTLDALVFYLEALAKEPILMEVHLANQKKERRGTTIVIGFEIRMRLRL